MKWERHILRCIEKCWECFLGLHILLRGRDQTLNPSANGSLKLSPEKVREHIQNPLCYYEQRIMFLLCLIQSIHNNHSDSAGRGAWKQLIHNIPRWHTLAAWSIALDTSQYVNSDTHSDCTGILKRQSHRFNSKRSLVPSVSWQLAALPRLHNNSTWKRKGNITVYWIKNCWYKSNVIAIGGAAVYHSSFWHESPTVLPCRGIYLPLSLTYITVSRLKASLSPHRMLTQSLYALWFYTLCSPHLIFYLALQLLCLFIHFYTFCTYLYINFFYCYLICLGCSSYLIVVSLSLCVMLLLHRSFPVWDQ